MTHTFEQYFAHMNDLVVFRDAERGILNVNPAFTRIFGGDPDDWAGRHFDGAALGAQIGAFHNSRAYGQVRADGKTYWVEWDEADLPDGGSIAIGRLNADRRSLNRRESLPERERRRNKSRVCVPSMQAKPAAIPTPPPPAAIAAPEPDMHSELPSDAAFAPPPPFAEETQERAQFTVLLAEDDPLSAKLATALLQREDCVVIHVTDGKQAVELARQRTFDLVFMDMRMPFVDGPNACRAIRALGGAWTDIPIVALTANAFEEDRKTCLAAGMTGFITKPISAQTLLAARERWTFTKKPARIA